MSRINLKEKKLSLLINRKSISFLLKIWFSQSFYGVKLSKARDTCVTVRVLYKYKRINLIKNILKHGLINWNLKIYLMKYLRRNIINIYTSQTQVWISIYPSNQLFRNKLLQTWVRWVYTSASPAPTQLLIPLRCH